VVLVAVRRLLRFRELRQLVAVSRWEGAVAVVTLLGVLGLGLLDGVVIGLGLVLLDLLRRVSAPKLVLLGRVPRTSRFAILAQSPESERIPELLLCRGRPSWGRRCRLLIQAAPGAHGDAPPGERRLAGGECCLARAYPLEARLGRLLRRGQKSPDRQAAELCRELTKWWPALRTFARVEGVEPTSNVAERALRPAVLWRKGSFGCDSQAGSRFVERLLTVAATCRQQGRELLDFMGEPTPQPTEPVLLQFYTVTGAAMEPTLSNSQVVVVGSYGDNTEPNHGDIIIFQSPAGQGLLVKRVVALPDESVEIRSGDVLVNGARLEEPYETIHALYNAPLTTVPPRSYFVLDDNRPSSSDSHVWGPVPMQNISGRVLGTLCLLPSADTNYAPSHC
jgi:signal peptidase I